MLKFSLQVWKENGLRIKMSEEVQATISKMHCFFFSGFIVIPGRTA
jgi:hypothetical protein